MNTHEHHPDGRLGPDLPYIARRLTTTMRAPDHRRLHLVLDDLGLSFPQHTEPLLLHRADRHAVTAGWHADHETSLLYEPVAGRELQGLVLTFSRALRLARRLALAALSAPEGSEFHAVAIALLAELGERHEP